jgi:hypothetical protein
MLSTFFAVSKVESKLCHVSEHVLKCLSVCLSVRLSVVLVRRMPINPLLSSALNAFRYFTYKLKTMSPFCFATRALERMEVYVVSIRNSNLKTVT